MVGVVDTAAVENVQETYGYYGSRNSATEAAAESVTARLLGAVIMAYDPTKWRQIRI